MNTSYYLSMLQEMYFTASSLISQKSYECQNWTDRKLSIANLNFGWSQPANPLKSGNRDGKDYANTVLSGGSQFQLLQHKSGPFCSMNSSAYFRFSTSYFKLQLYVIELLMKSNELLKDVIHEFMKSEYLISVLRFLICHSSRCVLVKFTRLRVLLGGGCYGTPHEKFSRKKPVKMSLGDTPKVKNRNKISIDAPIYKKFSRSVCNIVRNFVIFQKLFKDFSEIPKTFLVTLCKFTPTPKNHFKNFTTRC